MLGGATGSTPAGGPPGSGNGAGNPASGFLIGGETRYLRKYDGIGIDQFAGQALFAGPTAYLQLSQRSRLTLAWSAQVWGRPTGSTTSLDLVNFERHQARLIFGVNF